MPSFDAQTGADAYKDAHSTTAMMQTQKNKQTQKHTQMQG